MKKLIIGLLTIIGLSLQRATMISWKNIHRRI